MEPVKHCTGLIAATRETDNRLCVDDLPHFPLTFDWRIDAVTEATDWVIRAKSYRDIEWFDMDGPEPIRNPITGMPINVWHRTATQVYRVVLRRTDRSAWRIGDGKLHVCGCNIEFTMETV
ncbi:MAG: hypothetical protein WC911_10880 [Thermoleophilia bacterium]